MKAQAPSAAFPSTAAAPPEPWLARTAAGFLQANHMARFGIGATMKIANTYNRLKYSSLDQWRRSMYQQNLDTLLPENGGLSHPPVEIKDGWAIDTSMSLPHLDRVLDDSEKIIAERSGELLTADPYRSYFQDVWTDKDYEKYPSFLDFATSSEVLAAVAHYLKCIPILSTGLPAGIRFVESNAAFDHEPKRFKDSQLYHIDYYSLPNVYVIVLAREATQEHGPFTFLPRSVTQKAMKELGYCTKQRGYRVSDEDVYSVADRKDVIEYCYPRGTVLFMESSGCFHYGSRNAVKARFQLMVGYTGVCRTDFSDILLTPKVYPIRATDSRLRAMVLDKHMKPGTVV